MMDERSEQARAIFFEALDRPPLERTAFLDQRCGDDDELRADVESLLVNDQATDEFMATPVVARGNRTTGSLPDQPAESGRRIGRYEVRGVIASGGMGTVYEAAQDHPHRLVALKVLRHGAASPQALKRFRHEAEILGRLRHPNIAQIHDAGTFDEGQGAQPFFAMELVKGEALIAYADARGLDTRRRLELFVKVCEAVRFAHQKGVIHRDLKPDNILVDDFGEPKILDFGVARATDADIQTTTLRTDIGQLIGTVPYMSPEQVGGDPAELDTRSDVYSLGVVLYELLSGRLPLDVRNKVIPDAVRVIREEDPTPLSSVNRVFRGDVETIVAKALDKEKHRRYQSAAEFVADVRHYLADEPIVARPPSAFYQLRKFARRNKTFVSAAALVFVALSVGVAVASWQAVQARAEATKATAINDYLMDLFSLANPAEQSIEFLPMVEGPRILSIEGLMDEAAVSLETALAEWPEVQADLHYRLGRTYWGFGRVSAVEGHLRRAYELRAATLGENHPETLVVLNLLGGWVAEFKGDYEESVRMMRRAVYGLEATVGPEDRRTLAARVWLGSALSAHGYIVGEQATDVDEGEDLLRETIATCRRLFGEGDRLTLSAHLWYARSFGGYGRPAEVEQYLTPVFERSKSSLPEGDLITAMIAQTIGNARKGVIRGDWYPGLERDHAGAVELLLQARRWYQLQDAGVTLYAVTASLSASNSLRRLDRDEEADEILTSTLVDCRRKLGPDHPYTHWVLARYAARLRKSGHLQDAIQVMRDAGPETWVADNDWTLYLMFRYAWFLELDGQLAEAQVWAERTLNGRRRLLGDESRKALEDKGLLARIHGAQGHVEEAVALYREVVAGNRSVRGTDHWRTLEAMNALAWLLKDTDDPEKLAEAESLAKEALSLARTARGIKDELKQNIIDTLAVIHYEGGAHEEAVVLFEEIADARPAQVGEDGWHEGWSAVIYGRCLMALERYEEAGAVLLAVHADGEDESAREAIVDLYTVWGRPVKAAEYRAIPLEAEPAHMATE
jgi:non-specific serine/threonine protein kinase/serine/threonine-protein kinase